MSAWLGRGSLRTGFMILERPREFRARERDRRVKRQGLRESFQMLRDARRWGNTLGEAAELSRALWIRLSAAPAIAPYAAPSTWGELWLRLAKDGIDAKTMLAALPSSLRDGKAHLALVVFPIAERVGEAPRQIFWQALRLRRWRLYCPGVSARI